MRGRGMAFGVVPVAIAASLLAVAGTASASRGECLKAARGGKVVEESQRALVYRSGGKVHGCWYRTGASNLLPAQGKESKQVDGAAKPGVSRIDRSSLRLAGRYVAYPSIWTQSGEHFTHGPPMVARVLVYDLSRGATKYATVGNEQPFGIGVDALFVKRDGSVAWTYRVSGASLILPYTVVVKMDKATGGAERGLDSDSGHHDGYEIDGGSLALSGDGSRIYWSATSAEPPRERTLHAELR